MFTSNSTRHSPSALLAAIEAIDLPAPWLIRINLAGNVLALSFNDITTGQLWSRHLGGQTDIRTDTAEMWRGLDSGLIPWHGWIVQVHASEPV